MVRSRTLVVGAAAALLGLTGSLGWASPAHADVPGNDTPAGAIVLSDNTPVSESTVGATATADETSVGYQYLQRALTNAVWFSYTATSHWAKVTNSGSQPTEFVVERADGSVISWGNDA